MQKTLKKDLKSPSTSERNQTTTSKNHKRKKYLFETNNTLLDFTFETSLQKNSENQPFVSKTTGWTRSPRTL